MSDPNTTGPPHANPVGPTAKKGCGRWFLGCLVIPLAALLVLIVILNLVSWVRSGHVMMFPELRAAQAWHAEGTPGEIVGGWNTDDVMVYVSEGGLVGLDPENGDELWQLEPTETICGMAGDASGVGVVFLEGDTEASTVSGIDETRLDSLTKDGPAYSCDVALAVDLNSGEELWRTDALADGDPEKAHLLFSQSPRGEPVGDQVLVPVGGELVGLDQGSGAELWRDDVFAEDDCRIDDFLVRDDSEVVVAVDCGIDESVRVHVIDPATGKDLNSFEFHRGQSHPNSSGVARTRVVAADPIHLRIDLGHSFGVGGGYEPDTESPRLDDTPTLGFDEDGNVLHEIEVHDLFASSGTKKLFTVEGDRLYTTTDNASCGNEVRAHDLTTGDVLWETRISDPTLNVIDVVDGRLLVMLDGNGSFSECSMIGPEWDWQFYTVDTATGEAEPLSQPITNFRQPEPTELWWRGDRMIHLEYAYGDRPGRVIAYD